MPLRRWIILAILLIFSVGATWTAFRYDRPARDAIVRAQGKNFKKSDAYQLHGAIRKWGDWPWLMVFGAVLFLAAWKLRRRDWMRVLAAAMLASTIAGLLANASRLTTGRTRPRESPKIEQGFYGPWHNGKLTIGESKYNSFPSGHTATAFGFAGPILYAHPLPGLLALGLASLIAWSSIMIGAHHPSDVTVSIILSLVVSWFVWKWVRDHGDRTLLALRTRWNARKKS